MQRPAASASSPDSGACDGVSDGTVSSEEKAQLARDTAPAHTINKQRDFPAKLMAITGGKQVPRVRLRRARDTFVKSPTACRSADSC